MSDNVVQKLKETFLFRGLPEESLAAIAQKVIVRKLSKDDVLMRKGAKGDSVFMLHHGSVKIVTEDATGRELIINKCGPGETIGEMALLDQAPRSAGAIALEDAEALELKQGDFHALLNQQPDLAFAMIQGLSARLRFSTTYIEKAVEWSQRIADGDYSFIEHTPTILKKSGTDEDKAITLLSAFFVMVKRIKEREDEWKQQVEKLTFEIDQAKRKRDFDAFTSTDLYARIKEQAKQLRAQRLQDDQDLEGL
ncbi:MAG: cyclic nucleotide-binding domain-containing protein [Chloroflexota bacterium]